MRKIKKVEIFGFWGDKSVTLDFNKEINFLIGSNGSGKTTIINLIAAVLKADSKTLNKFQYQKIKIDFFPTNDFDSSSIQVEKINPDGLSYPCFTLETQGEKKIFDQLEEEQFFIQYFKDRPILEGLPKTRKITKDIHTELKDFVNLTWLSIHRKNSLNKGENNNFSTIDQKIKELSSDLVKYFGILDRTYSAETERFQKNILLSLIEDDTKDNFLSASSELDSGKEKSSLKQIFNLFGLEEKEYSEKLEKHFENFEKAITKLGNKLGGLEFEDLVALIGTKRVHTIVQQWNLLNKRKSEINKPKFTFINTINNLFQHKEISIDERNELLVRTQSEKFLPLTKLSSGEKQLLIILGQCLLQENCSHIYIADEPELSLHIEWQEELVASLRDINPNSQIIFATHSPDIVGRYSESVIQVEEVIK